MDSTVRPPKLIVIGHGRHGKDEFCKQLGFTFQSSSWICAEEVIYPRLRVRYGYKSVGECYEDRHNHRGEWHDLIAAYNNPDRARLGAFILSQCDVYCGLRSQEELYAIRAQGLVDFVVWVDRSDVLPPESTRSMKLSFKDADFVIDNNGTLTDLSIAVDRFRRTMNTWSTGRALIQGAA